MILPVLFALGKPTHTSDLSVLSFVCGAICPATLSDILAMFQRHRGYEASDVQRRFRKVKRQFNNIAQTHGSRDEFDEWFWDLRGQFGLRLK